MRFGKLALYIFLNGIIALVLTIHLGRWVVFGETVDANIIPPFSATTMGVNYKVDGHSYTKSFMRYDVSLFDRRVTVRYLSYNPEAARVNSFMGIYAEPLAWWLVFLIASSVLLLTNNAVFSRGTVFRLHRKFPWISMDEFFPLPRRRWYFRSGRKRESGTNSEQGPPKLDY